jgi:peptidoglycan/LPS O-acetylase OafA/YrhL
MDKNWDISMKLSHFAQGRDNNFNLIRLIAALMVLFSHSFAVAAGRGDPLTAILGMNMGAIAVDIFFITSGFLVTGSLLSRKSTLEFVWARVLRIYPGLVVMVFLMVFVLGLVFTSFPVSSFLENRETHTFVLKNTTLVAGVAYTLPGVFESVPDKGVVNGSLWTLPIEIGMYIILAIMWVALSVFGKLRVKVLAFSVVFMAVSSLLLRFANHFYIHSESHLNTSRLLYMFFTGAAYFFLKEHITLSRGVFWVAMTGLLISVLNVNVFYVVYNVVLAYILFWIAYIPAGAIRSFNRLGDYSYGTYIYAFPIEQSVATLIPGVSVGVLALISLLLTLLFAVLSWHFIEKRALALKGNPRRVVQRVIELYPRRPAPRTP